MKILLVHPEDSAEAGPWVETTWDLVVDLGWSGSHSYAQQKLRLGCSVVSIYEFLDHGTHRDRLRELLAVGLNQLVDSESIDWWEVFSACLDHSLGQLLMLSALAERIPEHAEVFATRAHDATRIMGILLQRKIKALSADPRAGLFTRTRRFVNKLGALRPSQVVEIAFDKWDADYRLRRHVSRRPSKSYEPVVLLPSSYQNVSRIQLAYAQMLPHRRFLLVVTRRSGRRVNLPPNIRVRSLAAYAPPVSPATEIERKDLLAKWDELKKRRFVSDRLLRVGVQQRTFDLFERVLKDGLRVRDAWRAVIANEPITAVLSADENNEVTRVPIILAKKRGLRTVSCNHGALNMTLAIRRQCSEIYLASGDMARDYMVEWCGLSANRVVMGAPQDGSRLVLQAKDIGRDWIVFFSSPYEVSSARTQVFYSEILPELCALASHVNRRIVVKLHPFESLQIRKAMIDRAVTAANRELIELRQGPMTSDLLERAWFTITVNSSVAVESTMNGVPCFLCTWFDADWHDYGKQLAKYSAGYPLSSPLEIRCIPERLDQIKITDATQRALHSLISPVLLDSLLFGSPSPQPDVVRQESTQGL
jgi:hypothetical protein